MLKFFFGSWSDPNLSPWGAPYPVNPYPVWQVFSRTSEGKTSALLDSAGVSKKSWGSVSLQSSRWELLRQEKRREKLEGWMKMDTCKFYGRSFSAAIVTIRFLKNWKVQWGYMYVSCCALLCHDVSVFKYVRVSPPKNYIGTKIQDVLEILLWS